VTGNTINYNDDTEDNIEITGVDEEYSPTWGEEEITAHQKNLIAHRKTMAQQKIHKKIPPSQE